MPRPLRLLVSLTTSLLAVALLLYATLGAQQEQKFQRVSHAQKQAGVNALFSFASPGSLFPPSAIISLTDDNSTFFLARPAAFGPALPSDGLSGPLWIGSGFGDDALSRGELGCSDIPGWDGGSEGLARALKPAATAKSRRTGPLAEKKDKPRRAASEGDTDALPTDDGTDDDLHQLVHQRTRHSSDHADIQSLQESAEIAGKVVLLKRGGCGFLAKVEWAQRRGGVAVIVGDDVRGGALIRMYARGDTSNVTIPSLFTSHTTAHLLSSLLPSRKTLPGLVPSQQKNKPTPTRTTPQSTSTPSIGGQNGPLASIEGIPHGKGWLHSLLTTLGLAGTEEQPTDSFRIGEDDWRDPKFRNLPTTTLPAPSTSTPASSSSAISSTRHTLGTKYTAPNSEHKAHWRSWLGSSRTSVTSITSVNSQEIDTFSGDAQPHQGLWVTLTPTNASSSPFFDTLLVLVVSPLVTLSVVYALLLLRSRMRRRRWRAPKSVVERLPVRTYHTISDSSSPSATSEAATSTTPLLQRPSSQLTSSPSRSTPQDEPATSSSVQRTTRDREEEKRETGLAEWRRRYGGRQKECVVCLEEYVDGVSQVMSLPCGHEFHVDCM